MRWRVAAFYQFVDLNDYELWANFISQVGGSCDLRGTLVIAPEGMNGTISGPQVGVDHFVARIREDSRFAKIEVKYAWSDDPPFDKFKVKVKKEIVSFRQPLDARFEAGEYVEPEDWDELISDPETLTVDTRNHYEYRVGRFEHAIDPDTRDFTAFADWAKRNLPEEKDRKIAMYCTGGIRCEKATALLKRDGYSRVYHLKGGILNYLEKIPADQSSWRGHCFVFDERIAVDHDLNPVQDWQICEGCWHPVQGEECPECGTIEPKPVSGS